MADEGAVEALHRCALFASVDADDLAELARHLRRRRFRRNEVIFHQGDPGDSLHVVRVGAVKIVLPSAEGEEAIIATLRPGDFFGELALLDGAPRSATAVGDVVAPPRSLPCPARPGPRASRCAPRGPRPRAAPSDRSRGGAPLPGSRRAPGHAPRPPRA